MSSAWCSIKRLEILKLPTLQRPAASNGRIYYIHDPPISDDKFGTVLTALTFAMNMDGLAFIGIKQHDDSKILVKLGHCLGIM